MLPGDDGSSVGPGLYLVSDGSIMGREPYLMDDGSDMGPALYLVNDDYGTGSGRYLVDDGSCMGLDSIWR
jgi:hypothetical protein